MPEAAPDRRAPLPEEAAPDRARARRAGIRGAFERAAPGYDEAAHIQREICTRLGAFAGALGLPPAAAGDLPVLDAGCGTGFGLAELDRLCPGAPRIALDLAPAMLAQARQRHARGLPAGAGAGAGAALHAVCGDLEHLPLAGGSLALIWSSLAIQWCDPGRALAECARVLAPGGLALVATLGPRTLWELRAAFSRIDDARHTIAFHSAEHWVRAAQRNALAPWRVDNVELHACAPDLRTLLRDIKRIGAATVDGGRRRTPLGRSAWDRLQADYETHRRPDGRLPATYDVVLLALRRMDPPSSPP